MHSSKRFNVKYLKKLPAGIILLVAIFAGSLFLFAYIMHEVLWDKEEAIDNSILHFVTVNVTNPQLTGFMKAVTYFASATFLQIAYAVLFLVHLLFRNYKRALEIASIGIGGFLINYFMKLSFQRTRPSNPLIDGLHNFSFPSGHATSAFIFYGLLTYLIWKTSLRRPYKIVSGIALISFSFLIGFSRIYLRVHYPSDVVAGFCIGFSWLFLTIWLFERLKKKSHDELNE